MIDSNRVVRNGAEYSVTTEEGWTHSFPNQQAARAYIRALKAGQARRAQLARIAAQAEKEVSA